MPNLFARPILASLRARFTPTAPAPNLRKWADAHQFFSSSGLFASLVLCLPKPRDLFAPVFLTPAPHSSSFRTWTRHAPCRTSALRPLRLFARRRRHRRLHPCFCRRLQSFCLATSPRGVTRCCYRLPSSTNDQFGQAALLFP